MQEMGLDVGKHLFLLLLAFFQLGNTQFIVTEKSFYL